MSEFDKVWNYIRFGESGDYAENEKNGRKIIRVTDYIDTVSPICYCVENEKFVGTRYGREAVEWVLE